MLLPFALLLALPFWPSSATKAGAQATALSAITIDVHDLATGDPLATFTYLVNVDNTGDPDASDPLDQPMAGTESHSDLVAQGDESSATRNLEPGKYLVSVRAPGHKPWGRLITLPADSGTVRIDLREGLAPLGKIKVDVFDDRHWVNSAPDEGESGLAGFHVTLEEQTNSQVSADYWNNPLCTNYLRDGSGNVILDGDGKPTIDAGNPGGDCVTDADGFVQIDNLGPATYFIYVTPPDGSPWVQTTTFDGGFGVLAGVRENDPGTGAPLEVPWEPDAKATTYWFGFTQPQDWAAGSAGTGTITGTARNWQGWPPFDTLVMGEPVANPYVALSETEGGNNDQVYMAQGDGDGNFTIPNVPDGSYTLSIWDEQLSYIIRFVQVEIVGGNAVNLGDVGVPRWFGWSGGTVYFDNNRNGIRDCTNPAVPSTCEPAVANFPMDQRWPNGSTKDATVTDASGAYEYPQSEGGPLGKWFVNEVGFTRFSASYPLASDPSTLVSPSVHDELNPDGPATPLPADLGGGLLHNLLVTEGHRSIVDWGKTRYGPSETGQIVGITYFDTTRNELDAYLQAVEDYEPGIPNIAVTLEGLGADNIPNTADDRLLNVYVTDKWQQPTNCPIVDSLGNQNADTLYGLNPLMGPNCIEVPATGNRAKDGAFDGGYAFADYCPNGFDEAAPDGDNPCFVSASDHGAGHTAPAPLVPGKYITHVWMPKAADGSGDTRDCNSAREPGPDNVGAYISDALSGPQAGCLYRVMREEDVNVDQGQSFTPSVTPFPCTGDQHKVKIDFAVNPRGAFDGQFKPLCDKRLIDLKLGQNANADFFLMASQPNGVDVQSPGRLVGLVADDVYFDRDKKSMWYGEPRPVPNIPIGVYDWKGRLFTTIKTDPNGTYEVLLPSGDTWNCPIPQGPCPAMYDVVVNDPGQLFSQNGTRTSGSTSIADLSDTGLMYPGLAVSGTGIPAGTTVASIVGPSSITLSNAATSSGTAAVRFGKANANYNPHYNTEDFAWDSWPGLLTQLDTPIIPTAGEGCQLPTGTPELLQVDPTSRPYFNPGDVGAARQLVLDGDNIGTTPGSITLTDSRGYGLSRTFTGVATAAQIANPAVGGIVSWGPPDGRTIIVQVPAASDTFLPGPKQLTIATADGIKSTNGLTVHVRGTVGSNAYTPPVVVVTDPDSNAHAIQNAIDAAPAGALIVVRPGVYHENLILWKRQQLQGYGPGGLIGTLEVANTPPDDARLNKTGTVIDGRFFQDNAAAYNAVLSARGPFAGVTAAHPVLKGAGVSVVAPAASTYTSGVDAAGLNAARIDGFGITTSHGDGAGGVQLQAYATGVKVTNNVLESDQGQFVGGIGVGQPYVNSHNENVYLGNNRIMGSGGINYAGGIALFDGSNNYNIADSVVCSNFSFNYGGGINAWGHSPGGKIHDSEIYYNESVDAGGGISIQQQTEQPVNGNPVLGSSSGDVAIYRNLIQQNYSGDDGGGIYVNRAMGDAVTLRNNLIVGNGASNKAGGIELVDSSNVRVIANTIADNVSTGSSEQSDGQPHTAGIGSDANTDLYQATLPAGAKTYSDPVAFFDDILWQNQAYTLDGNGPGATLSAPTTMDLEVLPTGAGSFSPRFSLLTTDYGTATAAQCGPAPLLQPAVCQGNVVGTDPGFVAASPPILVVSGSRLNPGIAAVQLVDTAPPTGLAGDYHLTGTSPAIDRGAGFSNFSALAPTQLLPTASSVLAPCSGAKDPRLTNVMGIGSTNVQVTSAYAFPTSGTYVIQIDNELMQVTAGQGTTSWTVARHVLGTAAATHLPTAVVRLWPTGTQSFPADVDREWRPMLRTLRAATPWDIGADEVRPNQAPALPLLLQEAARIAVTGPPLWSCIGTTGE